MQVVGTATGTAPIPDQTQASVLGTVGVRTNMEYAHLRIVPSAGYSLGRLAVIDASGAPTNAGMTGFRAQLAVLVAP